MNLIKNRAFFYKNIVIKLIVLSLSFAGLTVSQQEKGAKEHNNGVEAVAQSLKKTFGRDYKINRTPVESIIYLQHMITSYNAHMKHAILNWLKKEYSPEAPLYVKELSYLLSHLESVTTVKQAVVTLARAISMYKIMQQENSGNQELFWHERACSSILLQCSVVIVKVAREQLLMLLDEINSSLIYWRDQKQNPVRYFFHKSPLKWVMGKRQADEVAGNIKKLEKLEFNTRVALGRLTKHIYAFDIESDIDQAYKWINQLLQMIVCTDEDQEKEAKYDSRFVEVAEKLRFKLSCVNNLKDKVLSKIPSTIKPGHIARNWLTYAAALAATYAARYYYLQNTEFVGKLIGPDALKGYADQIQSYTEKYVIDPLQDTAKAIFVGRTNSSTDKENRLKISRDELKKVLEKLATPIPGWFGTYGLVQGQPLSSEEMKRILDEDAKGNTDPLLQLLYRIDKNVLALVWSEGADPLLQVVLSYVNLLGSYGTQSLEEQLRVTKNFAILAPGIISAGIGLTGLNKLYKYITAKDYTLIRLALLDINSLFVESDAPLSDHDYGKLIYLLQGLKIEAMRYLTNDDMRGDFLVDIAKLESHKFSVETKRGIIQNMFMKYPFLALNAKNA